MRTGATAAGVPFDITGTIEDAKAVPSQVTLDGGAKNEYDAVDKVPEGYRETVKKRLARVKPFGGR